MINNDLNYGNSFLSEPVMADQPKSQPMYFFSELPAKNLSELLPCYGRDFPKALLEYYLLLIALKKTIEALENRELERFDALVGENLCQIRATIIPLIFHGCLDSLVKIKASVQSIVEKVKKLLDSPSKNFPDFKTFLKSEGLEIHLSGSELLFVKFYILTVVKKQEGKFDLAKETTDKKKLRVLAPVSDKFMDNLINKLREEVSKISAPFLLEVAKEYKDNRSIEMLAKQYIVLAGKDKQRKECTPTFWTTKVVKQIMQHHRIPGVLWIQQKNEHDNLIKEFCIYYESSSEPSFVEKLPHIIDATKAVIVVKAICCRKNEKIPNREISHYEIEFNFADYLLAHGASHRQYQNSAEDVRVSNNLDDSYHYYKQKAIEWRCTREDPYLVHIYHIYCDRLKNVTLSNMKSFPI